MSDVADNLQVNQPNVINSPSTNWPDPLADASNKLKIAATNGQSGEQRNFDPISTSQQDALNHHLPEGGDNSGCCQNEVPDSFKTSQQKLDQHKKLDSTY